MRSNLHWLHRERTRREHRRAAPRRARARRTLILLALACVCIGGVPPFDAGAQFLPFGRNKVSHAEFDWHVLATDHFDIYYYPEMDGLARRGAFFAERSFVELEQRFNFTVEHRIPLIFYSSHIHFQQTNVAADFIPEGVGGFFEFMKGRVVIPYTGSLEAFRHVIQHELVHVFMHNKVAQVLRDHGVPPERYPPLWFVEGLAELYSTKWDSQAEMLLRDAVHHGYIVPLSAIGMINGTFLMYKEGQSILTFMEEEYGEETIVRIIDNLWKSADFRDVLRWSTGVPFEEIDRSWLRWLRKRIYPMVETRDRASDVSIPLVVEGFNSKPLWYQEGDSAYIVHVGNRTGYTCIYRSSVKGGESDVLVQGEKTDRFEAFHAYQLRMSLNSGGRLAFVTKSGGSDALHITDRGGTEPVTTLRFRELVSLGSPSWSPDGRRLVLPGAGASGSTDLYIVDAMSGAIERLTADHYDERDPAWSPDGRRIAFSSDRGRHGAYGKYGLFTIDPEGRRIDYIACGDANYSSPSWSSDGSTLLCTSDLEGTHDIFAIRVDGVPASKRTLFRVSSLLGAALDPVWSDKGDVVFTAFDGYRFQIRMLRDVFSRVDSLPRVSVPSGDEDGGGWNVPEWKSGGVAASIRYEREYQLDIAQSQISTDPVFGTVGGAALSVSDMLGNDNYYFLVYNTAQTTSELLSSFNIAITRMSLGTRSPFAYGMYSFSGRRYDFLDPDQYYYERAFGAYAALAYPLSAFERVEGSVSFGSSDKEALYELRQRKALLLTNSISYVRDNALYYMTGPLDGHRFNATLSFTTDIQYSNVNYFSVMLDYRRYYRLSTRSTLATRFEILYNEGKEARRYFLGGSWDLRGWPRWSIRGTKRWLSSAELRFPLLERVGFDFPFGSIDLGILRGALFADAGNAWDDKYGETLGSIGAGLRFNLFGVIVLRYDFGKRIENDMSTFQSGLFQQFFFGWDF